MPGMGGLLHSMMGGRNSGTAQQPMSSSQPDVYDVDRWKRADDLDQTTMVQAVRRDWEQKQAQKQSLTQKIKAFFKKDTNQQTADIPEPTDPSGTVLMPELKEAQRRIKTDVGQEVASPQVVTPQQSCQWERNYLGLAFPTALGGFFSSNPLNSAILAVDQLGLGPLSLNQVTGCPSKARGNAPKEQSKNTAEASSDPNYITTLRESREQQKYKVRIIE